MVLLRGLHAIGEGVAPASVTFADGLTVIHGASDTGKSYIADMIDYMLGGTRALRQLPESEGYDKLRLEWSAGRGPSAVFERDLDGGELLYTPGSGAPPMALKARHSATTTDNVSRTMLSAIGADGWVVIRNSDGDTENVGFRDFLHLVIGSEDRVFGKSAPFSSGRFETNTKEKSLVRCVLAGRSDPPQVKGAGRKEKALSRKQRELLDQLMGQLIGELSDLPSRVEAHGMRERLLASLQAGSEGLEPVLLQLVSERRRYAGVHALIEESNARERSISESLTRFALLSEQYRSDLERLDVVEESAVVMGLYEPGRCPLCGQELAVTTHEHEADASMSDAVQRERSRVRTLRAGLLTTMDELERERAKLRVEIRENEAVLRDLSRGIASLSAQVAPSRSDLEILRAKLSEVEAVLAKYAQLESIERFRADIRVVEGQPLPDLQLSPLMLSDFSRELASVLTAWGVRGGSSAHVSADNLEPILEGKRRADRGKGVRAILFAAQMVALAQLCLRNGQPHPGFVVLDSPLVTYKSPKRRAGDGGGGGNDELIADEVAQKFYRFLDEEFLGQAIVLENVDPGDAVVRGSVAEFAGVEGGRWGFFDRPPVAGGHLPGEAE